MSLVGSELPRIFTPPLRDLSDPANTLGYDCIDFAAAVGVTLFPWERWFLIHALELLEDGSLRFRTVILLVARQNGKTTLLKILALFFMYVLGRLLVIGTAQNLDIAEETWKDAVALAESSDELAPDIEQVVKQSGKMSLILSTGERYKAKASTGRGPRGLTGDLVIMDELREHHTWEAWAGVSSTTMAVDSALVVTASNAGDILSVVLRSLRVMCMDDPRTEGVDPRELAAFRRRAASVEDDVEVAGAEDDENSDGVGFFEWSAPDGVGIWDRSGWVASNPSLGYTITEAALASQAKVAQAGGDAEWVFRTENLCQWRPTGGSGPFPGGAWDLGLDDESTLAEDDSPIGVGIDTSSDGTMTYVAIAGNRDDGNVHVEVIARRVGNEWITPWLTSPDRKTRHRWGAVAWQSTGAPVSALTDELGRFGTPLEKWSNHEASGLPLAPWSGPDLSRASGMVTELVRAPKPATLTEPAEVKRRLFHRMSPVVDVPASTAATRTLGDSWVISRERSPVDAAPLVAVFAAVWALSQAKAPFRSAYDDHDLMVV